MSGSILRRQFADCCEDLFNAGYDGELDIANCSSTNSICPVKDRNGDPTNATATEYPLECAKTETDGSCSRPVVIEVCRINSSRAFTCRAKVTKTATPGSSNTATSTSDFTLRPTTVVTTPESGITPTTTPTAINPTKTENLVSGQTQTPDSNASATAVAGLTNAKSNASGISSGAAAGIGIGGAIAGAAIASIIFFLLFRRYRRRNQQQPMDFAHHLPNYGSDNGKEKTAIGALPAKNGGVVVESYLPQPAEDDAITGEMSRLRDKIKNHIQSYYHTSPVPAQVLDQNKLKDVSRATGIPVARMAELLLNPHSRLAALRMYLAWVILSRCDGRGQAATSLLPGEVATFATLIADVDGTSTAKNALASRWKAISGELLQAKYGPQQGGVENKISEHSVALALKTADAILAPFVSSSPETAGDKRLRNLDGIVRRAAQLAFLLFSQPSSWGFDWTAGGAGSAQGRLVVFPGLLQTVSEEGVVQRPPRPFDEPEIVTGL